MKLSTIYIVLALATPAAPVLAAVDSIVLATPDSPVVAAGPCNPQIRPCR